MSLANISESCDCVHLPRKGLITHVHNCIPAGHQQATAEFWVSSFGTGSSMSTPLCLWDFRNSFTGEFSVSRRAELPAGLPIQTHFSLAIVGGLPINRLNVMNIILQHQQSLCIAQKIRHLHKVVVSTTGARCPEF